MRTVDAADLRLLILTAFLVVGFKLAWRNCRPTEPRVFLAPLVAMVQLSLGVRFAAGPEGYWNEAWGILIAKGCGGMNFFLIAHCLLVFMHLRSFHGRAKVQAYGIFLLAAHLLTLPANFSRIICALILGRTGLAPSVLTGRPHLALGTFVYFLFLVAGNGLAGILIRGWNRRTEGAT